MPAAAQPGRPASSGRSLSLRYLGNAGWEITDGRRVVLVDPFLTQFARWPSPGSGPVRAIGPDSLYLPDTTLINRHVDRADYLLITHGLSDHALDAPDISRRTGAVIIGHETAANLARAAGVPDSNLITAIGGEDYDFGGFSLRVIPNRDSPSGSKPAGHLTLGSGVLGCHPRRRSSVRFRDDRNQTGYPGAASLWRESTPGRFGPSQFRILIRSGSRSS